MPNHAPLVVFLCILGAACLLGLGYAATYRFKHSRRAGGERDSEMSQSNVSQAQYMREVRLRHQDDLYREAYGMPPMVCHSFDGLYRSIG